MNLDKIMKLCSMIDHTFKIMASYCECNGDVEFISCELIDEHREKYLPQLKMIIDNNMRTKDIKVNINEIGLTWISIPVITGEILRGYLVLEPFCANLLDENSLIDILTRMGWSDDLKTSILNYYNMISFYPYKEYIKIVKVIYFNLYGVELDESKLRVGGSSLQNDDDDQNDVVKNNDEMDFHGTYLFERCMLECIRLGNMNNLKQVLQTGSAGKVGTMIIGNELRQAKNTFIVTTALATRAAIEGGVNSELAFSISDLYIRQIEIMKSVSDIERQTEKMLYEFTRRVHDLVKIKAYSGYVNKCCNYIQSNINSNLSVCQIADYLRISQEHLSRVFRQETGMAIIEYIRNMKVKEAKFLLKYTDNTLVEISEKLAFSSQSHFNSVFKGEMGLTPKQYRDKVRITTIGMDLR